MATAAGRQLVDLSRGAADLAGQVGEIWAASPRRGGSARSRAPVGRARVAVSDPLAAEIGELGGLVKQLAVTVASHQTTIDQLSRAPAATHGGGAGHRGVWRNASAAEPVTAPALAPPAEVAQPPAPETPAEAELAAAAPAAAAVPGRPTPEEMEDPQPRDRADLEAATRSTPMASTCTCSRS